MARIVGTTPDTRKGQPILRHAGLNWALVWYGGPVIGVIHLPPLPGSPGFAGDMRAVVARAVEDARAYESGGAHAVIVENHGDAPFFKQDLPPSTVAGLTRCAAAVRDAVSLPLGINALRNGAAEALAVAAAVDAAFIRVNVHAGVVATDQGLIEGRAAETLRLRRALGTDARIVADVHVKHGRTLHATDIARAAIDLAKRGGADAVVVSGEATGAPTDLADLRAVREALPDAVLMAGSGVSEASVAKVLTLANAVIVGTALERGGQTGAPVDQERVRRFVSASAVPR